MTREEAIRRIKAWRLDSDDMEVLSAAIPELQESMDERIGNIIYCIVRDNKEVEKILEGNGISVDSALAYLERQKDLFRGSTEMVEQKPVEWSETFEENIRNLLHDKLTWHSEDGSMSTTVLIDNKTLKDIINGIWFYVGKEALKYPNKELKTAEWTDDDEQHLKWLCRIIHSRKNHGELSLTEESELGNWIDKWINHNPHPHWKPTKAMLDALNWAMSEFHPDCADTMDNLTYLYKELEQLFYDGN